ncbi:MAG: DNA mismatch repair protein MutS [Planctomycetes bacterium]|nr:DNA mismatch repair protein MutS [Planctomycetota bacterium]
MMRQYLAVKEKYPAEILFFRMGDFYEMFFDDARIASQILGIALTSRNKENRDRVPMAGVPVRAVDSYLSKLLHAGRKVAICEQVEDPEQATGLVEREVVRVISPGTITDEKIIGEKANNFIAALSPGEKGVGLAWIDVTTGEFLVWESPGLNAILTEVSRIQPAECLLPEGLLQNLPNHPELQAALQGIFMSSVPDWCFDQDTAYRALTEHFHTRTLEGFGCEQLILAVRAAGGLLHYLRETQKNALKHLTRMRPFPSQAHMVLDRATQRSLEITETCRGERQGSLLASMDQTVTSLGARRLREWLLKPLRQVEAIVYRQEAVDFLVKNRDPVGFLTRSLREIHDLERLSSRIAYGSANARDLAALGRSLEALPPVASALGNSECRFFKDRLSPLGGFADLAREIAATLVEAPTLSVKDGGLIRTGCHPELDRLRQLASEGTQWIARFQKEELERSGIPNLKVGYNRVFGYYIEITNAQAAKVPPHYIRKQTLKNCERYITPELKDYENQVLHAREASMELEYQIFCELREKAARHISAIQTAAQAVSEIDAVLSFARTALERGYIRPAVNESDRLVIEEGRHPVVELLVPPGDFVPNSAYMDSSSPIMVLTGPNMAGKSTYIRQVALLVLLAQSGGFIPAGRAEIGVVDRIFTRVGAADDITRGQSTFMVEMQETANILNNATGRSLIILDEVGRGTSTFDGLSLAWAITEHISEKLKARTLFATHYHELTEITLTHPQVRNFTFSVKEWNEEIVFLRKVLEGTTDKSYGIQVARLAGIPREVLERSQEILINLENQALDIHGQPAFAPARQDLKMKGPEKAVKRSKAEESAEPASCVQLDLFINANEAILKELKHLEVEKMTPIEAIIYLAELRKRIL